ncbi:uncharacterized protein ChaoS9_125 [Halobacterium phage ChaoS9]|uniref:Phage protein Gp138 N-terminal domain-containing protein n=1 Tax=Halobacterium phage ChaoS9 TaxID=2847105 RepID=A0A481V781_9CAUD|nr:uncharacterized protein KMC41_gp26 [Halobacterium phage ChaoS9]QBI90032.1 uncharacterized protein ChaoS9_125 [Halobacterium phage ChaoS9]
MTVNIVQALRLFIKQEVRGIYTVSMVVVEAVDEDERRAEVSLKTDENVIIDNVPIASPFAADGAGMIVPVGRGDEGLLLHSKEPLEKLIQEHGHEEDPGGQRRFTLEAGVLLPLVWLDEDDVPDHESGEFLIDLGDGAPEFRMNPETGGFQLVDGSGHGIVSDGEGNFEWYASSVDIIEGTID